MRRRALSGFLVLALGLLALLIPRSSPILAAPAAIQGLHVSGNTIVNAANQPVRLLGVNRSGGEYMCVQGRGIWDGPVDAAAVQAMLTWKINTVRIPLNEDCWLAINGVAASMSGATYQQAVVDYVNLLNSFGIIAIVELHWNAPGTTLADKQAPMPDLDHTPAFWASVANTFKGNSSVVFDLFNEPYPDNNSDTTAGWTCWRDGGTCAGITYPVAGFQSLVNTVRATGATNIIMLGGLQFSNALSQWLAFKPTDPTGNLVAAWHSYNFNLCSNVTCWNQNVLPVIQSVPLVAGEIGENDCAHGYIDPLMTWLDSHNTGYLAWTWDAWGICAAGPVLIDDYYGAPTAFGQGFKDHLAAVVAGPTVTALPAATVGPGVLQIRIKASGTDNNQQGGFTYQIANPTGWPLSNMSVRIYFTLDNGNAASSYILESYHDESGGATISGPTQASGNLYYFTVNYGTTALGPGGAWEFQTNLHLVTWASTFDGSNDWYHTGYAVGALPASYALYNYIPAYVNGTLAWGQEPGGPAVATNTPTRTNTPTGPTNTPTRTPTPSVANPDIRIVDFAFQPANLTINLGASVTWLNTGAASHTTTSDSSLWDSGVLAPNQNFTFTPSSVGSFPFHCNIHTSMTGTITVVNGPTNTPTRTNTPIGPSPTATRTPTRTNTPTGPSPTATRTPTRTNTPIGPTSTPTRTPTPGGGSTCSPVTATITAPFTFDGAGTFCWRSSNLGSNINSYNLANLTVNGVNFTNQFQFTSNLPPKAADGFWYVSYTGNFPWSHFEAK